MDLSFFPFAHENCLHFKVAPVINDKKTSKAPLCDRSSPCNTMNLRSTESSPQIGTLEETIKEMCWVSNLDGLCHLLDKLFVLVAFLSVQKLRGEHHVEVFSHSGCHLTSDQIYTSLLEHCPFSFSPPILLSLCCFSASLPCSSFLFSYSH